MKLWATTDVLNFMNGIRYCLFQMIWWRILKCHSFFLCFLQESVNNGIIKEVRLFSLSSLFSYFLYEFSYSHSFFSLEWLLFSFASWDSFVFVNHPFLFTFLSPSRLWMWTGFIVVFGCLCHSQWRVQHYKLWNLSKWWNVMLHMPRWLLWYCKWWWEHLFL